MRKVLYATSVAAFTLLASNVARAQAAFPPPCQNEEGRIFGSLAPVAGAGYGPICDRSVAVESLVGWPTQAQSDTTCRRVRV